MVAMCVGMWCVFGAGLRVPRPHVTCRAFPAVQDFVCLRLLAPSGYPSLGGGGGGSMCPFLASCSLGRGGGGSPCASAQALQCLCACVQLDVPPMDAFGGSLDAGGSVLPHQRTPEP